MAMRSSMSIAADQRLSLYEKAPPPVLLTQDSPASWTVRAQQPSDGLQSNTQRASFLPAASPMAERPVSAAAAAAPLYPGSDGHRRAHIQSLAKMTREALAERLFSEKLVIINLQERLKLSLVDNRKLEAALARARLQQSALGNSALLAAGTLPKSDLVRNLKHKNKELQHEKAALIAEHEKLKRSTRATKVSELRTEVAILQDELQRQTSLRRTLRDRLSQLETWGGSPTGRRKLSEVLESLQQACGVLQTEANFLANGCQGYGAADFVREPRLAPAGRVLETLQTHVTEMTSIMQTLPNLAAGTDADGAPPPTPQRRPAIKPTLVSTLRELVPKLEAAGEQFESVSRGQYVADEALQQALAAVQYAVSQLAQRQQALQRTTRQTTDSIAQQRSNVHEEHEHKPDNSSSSHAGARAPSKTPGEASDADQSGLCVAGATKQLDSRSSTRESQRSANRASSTPESNPAQLDQPDLDFPHERPRSAAASITQSDDGGAELPNLQLHASAELPADEQAEPDGSGSEDESPDELQSNTLSVDEVVELVAQEALGDVAATLPQGRGDEPDDAYSEVSGMDSDHGESELDEDEHDGGEFGAGWVGSGGVHLVPAVRQDSGAPMAEAVSAEPAGADVAADEQAAEPASEQDAALPKLRSMRSGAVPSEHAAAPDSALPAETSATADETARTVVGDVAQGADAPHSASLAADDVLAGSGDAASAAESPLQPPVDSSVADSLGSRSASVVAPGQPPSRRASLTTGASVAAVASASQLRPLAHQDVAAKADTASQLQSLATQPSLAEAEVASRRGTLQPGESIVGALAADEALEDTLQRLDSVAESVVEEGTDVGAAREHASGAAAAMLGVESDAAAVWQGGEQRAADQEAGHSADSSAADAAAASSAMEVAGEDDAEDAPQAQPLDSAAASAVENMTDMDVAETVAEDSTAANADIAANLEPADTAADAPAPAEITDAHSARDVAAVYSIASSVTDVPEDGSRDGSHAEQEAFSAAAAAAPEEAAPQSVPDVAAAEAEEHGEELDALQPLDMQLDDESLPGRSGGHSELVDTEEAQSDHVNRSGAPDAAMEPGLEVAAVEEVAEMADDAAAEEGVAVGTLEEGPAHDEASSGGVGAEGSATWSSLAPGESAEADGGLESIVDQLSLAEREGAVG